MSHLSPPPAKHRPPPFCSLCSRLRRASPAACTPPPTRMLVMYRSVPSSRPPPKGYSGGTRCRRARQTPRRARGVAPRRRCGARATACRRYVGGVLSATVPPRHRQRLRERTTARRHASMRSTSSRAPRVSRSIPRRRCAPSVLSGWTTSRVAGGRLPSGPRLPRCSTARIHQGRRPRATVLRFRRPQQRHPRRHARRRPATRRSRTHRALCTLGRRRSHLRRAGQTTPRPQRIASSVKCDATSRTGATHATWCD